MEPEKRKEALSAGAEIIIEEAKRRVPVDTGNLRDNGLAMEVSENEARIGWTEDGFYGRFIEDGTSKMAAKPYLRPAHEAKKKEVQDAMIKKLGLD